MMSKLSRYLLWLALLCAMLLSGCAGTIVRSRAGWARRKCNTLSAAFISTRVRANSSPRGPMRGTAESLGRVNGRPV